MSLKAAEEDDGNVCEVDTGGTGRLFRTRFTGCGLP